MFSLNFSSLHHINYNIYIKEGRRKLTAITSEKLINELKFNHSKGLKSSSNVRDLTEYRLFH